VRIATPDEPRQDFNDLQMRRAGAREVAHAR
jgi:hypothetical protein